MSRPWGIPLRFSVHLRRKLGREPRRDEVERATANFKKGDSLDVTAEEMMEAFNKGKEVIYTFSSSLEAINLIQSEMCSQFVFRD